MNRRSIFFIGLAIVLPGISIIGCGPGPIVQRRTHTGCPWCSPNGQVQVGLRSMGKSFHGNIWKEFWVGDSGQEYDPEEVSKKVWSYIEKSGYSKTEELQGNGFAVPAWQVSEEAQSPRD